MSTIEVTVNGVDRTSAIQADSIEFSMRVSGRSAASFTMDHASGSNRPTRGQSIGIFYDGTRIWSGLIQDFEEVCLVEGGGTLAQHEFRVSAVSLEATFDRRLAGPAVYAKTVFTADAGTDTLTAAGHGLQNGYIVQLVTTDALPGGLSTLTDYHVINKTTDTFQLSLTSGGGAVDVTSAGTGTHYFWWTTGSIVKDLILHYADADNITTTDWVEVGIPVERRIYSYDALTRAIDELAGISEYVWNVDAEFKLHFGPRAEIAAPFDVTTATAVRSITLTRTGENYANVVRHKIAWEAFAPSDSTFAGDGSTRVWQLGARAEQIVSVTLNDETVTFGIEGVDAAPYLWNPGQTRFVQDDGETVLTSSDELIVTYRALAGNVLTATNATEISNTATIEGNSGRYEILAESSDTSADSGADRAASILDARDQIEVIFGYTVNTIKEPDTYMLAAGQIQTVNLSALSINQALLIDEVNFRAVNSDELEAQVRAISSDRFFGAVAFFQALAGGGSALTIGGSGAAGGSGGGMGGPFTEEHVLTGNLTITGPTPVDGRHLIEIITQDSTPRTITWGSNFYAGSGSNINPTAGSITIFTFFGRSGKWWPSSPSISF